MNHFARQHYGNPKRTRQDKRAALVSLLNWRRSLDGLDGEQLAHTHGLSVAECAAALEDARKHRGAREQ